jgi:hypothetical protein
MRHPLESLGVMATVQQKADYVLCLAEFKSVHVYSVSVCAWRFSSKLQVH